MADERFNHAVPNAPPSPFSANPQPPWPSTQPPVSRRSTQWPAVAAVAIALIARGVAISSWFRPLPETKPPSSTPAPTFSTQQIADAKAKVCAAYDRIHHAVLRNTGRNGGTDPASVLGLAANARIALYDGGQYLTKVLAQQPATPTELGTAVMALIDAYQELAVNYMAEATDAEIQSSFQTLETTGSKVAGMCT
jgi:hypothetical protein